MTVLAAKMEWMHGKHVAVIDLVPSEMVQD
jgi:hypothetical protein